MAEASSAQDGLGHPDRLKKSELDDIRHRYTNATKRFTNWIEVNATAHGWTEARAPTSSKSWAAAVQDLRKYRKKLNQELGFLDDREDAELESPFAGKSALQIAQRAEYLLDKDIVLPRVEQDSLARCIELRKQANRHFSSLTMEDMRRAEDWANHVRSNRNHKFFIAVINYILRLLWDHKYYFATQLNNILTEMKHFTKDVMDAWGRYRDSQIGLIQATLITHAAAERASRVENDWIDEMREDTGNDSKLVWLVKHWQEYRDLDVLNMEHEAYGPSLLADVRGLLGKEHTDQKIRPISTLKENLELLHFPTATVLQNFQTLSKIWDGQEKKVPVPGYPVDLGHVYSEDIKYQAKGKGTKRKLDNQQQEARKKLKTDLGRQIQLIWKYLNELNLVENYQPVKDSKTDKIVGFKARPREEQLEYFPLDTLSFNMNKVFASDVEGKDLSGRLHLATSFNVQLLAKISQLFDADKINKKQLLGFQTTALVAEEENEPHNDTRETHRNVLDSYRLRRVIYNENRGAGPLYKMKRAMALDGNVRSPFSANFTWILNREGHETFRVVDGQGERFVKIPEDDQTARLVRVDPAHHPEGQMDVSWFADLSKEGSRFYFRDQPQFVGHVALQRRLLDHLADVQFCDIQMAVFTMAHLILALNVLEDEESTARQDPWVLQHVPGWFPDPAPANATDLLQLVGSRLQRTGANFDFSGTEIGIPKPVNTLVKIFLDGDEKDYSIELFARHLEEHYAEGEVRQYTTSRPLPWGKLVGILKRYLPKLPCGDIPVCFYNLGFPWITSLRTIGQTIGCLPTPANENTRCYHARLLYFILDDFKAKEDISISMRAQGRPNKYWKINTHLNAIKKLLLDDDKRRKKSGARQKTYEKLLNKN